MSINQCVGVCLEKMSGIFGGSPNPRGALMCVRKRRMVNPKPLICVRERRRGGGALGMCGSGA